MSMCELDLSWFIENEKLMRRSKGLYVSGELACQTWDQNIMGYLFNPAFYLFALLIIYRLFALTTLYDTSPQNRLPVNLALFVR